MWMVRYERPTRTQPSQFISEMIVDKMNEHLGTFCLDYPPQSTHDVHDERDDHDLRV